MFESAFTENSPKELVRSAVRHKESHRVPYNFMFSPPAEKRLREYYGADDLIAALDMPMFFFGAKDKPLYAYPEIYGETITDQFGVVWSTSQIDRGSPIGPPLRDPDLSRYSFPDPDNPTRFFGLAEEVERRRERFLVAVIGDFWERAGFMRGLERLCLDVLDKPRFVEELLDGIKEYVLRTLDHLATYKPDAVFLSDDYGTQTGLIIAPRHWRQLVKPCLKEIYQAAKRRGLVVMHHTCGNVREIIPDLIEIGLDILHPIQPETMDIFSLKKEFGSELTFCGGIGTQHLLPHGTPAEIRDTVRRTLDVMARGGGYILEPGITLQDDVPLDNMVAMIETAREYRR
ncbi:MAG: uroporphyrinogen decarboxylase family protein [bacterium]|nr:uroporphyrinogen decarboxylase family protein [bacterium]